ncbi:DUF3800 domain-containing protein [Nocardia mangyaensis]|uniref:DUF3800 domain-containing protein n=1 Tax=Nocardia mangyaensis TaxID=2213200 RepID=UPI002674E2BD|nr:DUF3800 domain-containing protein [Nocardia mangyaensis]MDO3650454.1 DUF3800 domain-containing protein [Nocardia mangyaensis]
MLVELGVFGLLLCYLDESGDEQGLRTATDPPVLVIAGIVVDHRQLHGLVYEFLQLEKKFYPALNDPSVRLSELITYEIRGCDLRRDIRAGSRNRRRAVFSLVADTLRILEQRKAKIVGEIHVKGDKPLPRWVYAEIVADIAGQFEAQLEIAQTVGTMILDANQSEERPRRTPVDDRAVQERRQPLPPTSSKALYSATRTRTPPCRSPISSPPLCYSRWPATRTPNACSKMSI